MSIQRFYEPGSIFDMNLHNFFRNATSQLSQDFDHSQSTLGVKVDMHELDNETVVTAELPGMKKKDIKVELNEDLNCLVLKGQLHKEEEFSKAHRYYSERSYGSFVRTLKLPAGSKHDKVKAVFEDGLLKVHIAKAEVKNPKTIEIS